jgi:hypothetical protein
MESKDTDAALAWVRAELFQDQITALTVNERGQFYLHGKLIPYATLLKALGSPPESDDDEKPRPRMLKITLPAGAKTTDAVYHFRLKQLVTTAGQIFVLHELILE